MRKTLLEEKVEAIDRILDDFKKNLPDLTRGTGTFITARASLESLEEDLRSAVSGAILSGYIMLDGRVNDEVHKIAEELYTRMRHEESFETEGFPQMTELDFFSDLSGYINSKDCRDMIVRLDDDKIAVVQELLNDLIPLYNKLNSDEIVLTPKDIQDYKNMISSIKRYITTGICVTVMAAAAITGALAFNDYLSQKPTTSESAEYRSPLDELKVAVALSLGLSEEEAKYITIVQVHDGTRVANNRNYGKYYDFRISYHGKIIAQNYYILDGNDHMIGVYDEGIGTRNVTTEVPDCVINAFKGRNGLFSGVLFEQINSNSWGKHLGVVKSRIQEIQEQQEPSL